MEFRGNRICKEYNKIFKNILLIFLKNQRIYYNYEVVIKGYLKEIKKEF